MMKTSIMSIICALVLCFGYTFVCSADQITDFEITGYELDPESKDYLGQYVDRYDLNHDGQFNINDVLAGIRDEAREKEYFDEHGEEIVTGIPFAEFDEMFRVFTAAPGKELDIDRNGRIEGRDLRSIRVFDQYYTNNDAKYPGPTSIEYFEFFNGHNARDINSDGKFNARDVLALMKYILGDEVEIDETLVDVNGDGKTNARDVTAIITALVDNK